VLAQLACLAAALSYAFAGIFGRRFQRMGVAPLATAGGQVSASTLLGALVLGETLLPRHFLRMVLIGGSVAFIDGAAAFALAPAVVPGEGVMRSISPMPA
jgi:drug/metabolite transporter (DMT)-like permease